MEAMSTGRIPEWTISDRLRKARESAGLTHEQLAATIGVGRSTIYNYESPLWTRGRRAQTLHLWAIACDVDPTWIDPDLNGPPPWDRGRAMRESLSACTSLADFRQQRQGFPLKKVA